MKKIISICSALIFAFTISKVQQVNAQDYLITFAGTGATTTVTTVEVENLSTGKTTTLNGGDILHLTSVVGISPLETNNSSAMSIYPNPMMDNSILTLHPPEAGDVVITIYEMTGKTVAKIHIYLENSRQEFRLSGIKNGVYLINVTGNSYQNSGKILCTGQIDVNPVIEKVSSNTESNIEKISKKQFSETQGTVYMYYTAGERLIFKAISGIYSTIKTDIPTEDKTFIFDFIPCTDGDSNNYPIVEIGNQTWMAENLKTTKFNDGADIPMVTEASSWSEISSPAYCWYNNDEAENKVAYGAMYNWFAISTGNLCPVGWHVSTDEEWKALEMQIGMNQQDADGTGYRGTDQAIWLKSSSGWNTNGNGTNSSGFSAVPGGWRVDGIFSLVGDAGGWWSSTESAVYAWYRTIGSKDGTIWRNEYSKQLGFSVRCIKD